MEQILLSSLLFASFGGIVRAIIGIVKYFEKNKSEKKIRFWYIAFSILVAGFVGAVSGAIINSNDWRLCFLVGYAGTDFFEGLYKIKQKQGFEI